MSNTFATFSQTASFPDNAFELYAKTTVSVNTLYIEFTNIEMGGTYIIKALVRSTYNYQGTTTSDYNHYKNPYLCMRINNEVAAYYSSVCSQLALSRYDYGSPLLANQRFGPIPYSDNFGPYQGIRLMLGGVPYTQHPAGTFSFITAQINNTSNGAISVYSSGGIGTPELYSSTASTGSTNWDNAGYYGVIPWKPTMLIGHSSGTRRNLGTVSSFAFDIQRPAFMSSSGTVFPSSSTSFAAGSSIYIYRYKDPVLEI